MLVTFLMIALGLVTVLLGFVILIQEPKQAGLSGAFGLGGSDQMMGTTATSGIGRFTAILSVIFFVLCILVGVAASSDMDSSRLNSDTVEPGFGELDGVGAGTPDGVGDALGDAIGDATPTATETATETATDGGAAVETDSGEASEETPAVETPAGTDGSGK